MSANNLDANLSIQILDYCPNGVVVFDKEEKIIWSNITFQELLGVSIEEIVGMDEPTLLKNFLEPIESSVNVYHLPPRNKRPQRWVLIIPNTIKADDGSNLKVRYVTDVTEIMRLNTEINSLARQLENTIPTDELTGLLNHKATVQALEPQVSRSRRYGNPLSMIVIAIDGISGETGQSEADRDNALVAVAHYLKDQLRWVDLIGRTDDMELTIILPETKLDAAQTIAEKIQQRFASMPVHMDSTSALVKLQARFGVTSWEKGDDLRMMQSKSKEALEKARSGKNIASS